MDQAQSKRRVYEWAKCVPHNAHLRKQYGDGPFTEHMAPRSTNIDKHLIYIRAGAGNFLEKLVGIPRIYLVNLGE